MWKGAATGNPFQLVANYSQVGDRQVREAAKRLQEAAERQGDAGGKEEKEGEDRGQMEPKGEKVKK